MRDFHGVYVPVPTPFRGDEVATDRLKGNFGKWNETALNGYVVLPPRELCEVYALAREGQWEEAKGIAARMMLADRGVPGRYGIGGLKAALDLQGFYSGPCRAPLGTPDGDGIDEIKESLASAGLL